MRSTLCAEQIQLSCAERLAEGELVLAVGLEATAQPGNRLNVGHAGAAGQGMQRADQRFSHRVLATGGAAGVDKALHDASGGRRPPG